MRAELLTYEQAAAYFPGKSPRWVRDTLVATRRVDVVKIGKTRFVVAASLTDLVASNTYRGIRRAR